MWGKKCGEGKKAGKFHKGAWRVTVHGVAEADTVSQQTTKSNTVFLKKPVNVTLGLAWPLSKRGGVVGGITNGGGGVEKL